MSGQGDTERILRQLVGEQLNVGLATVVAAVPNPFNALLNPLVRVRFHTPICSDDIASPTLPSNAASSLDDLVTNPGSYATWNGPYIQNRFSQITDDYKRDAWNSLYSYGGGVTITSTGSGSNIVRKLAASIDDLLINNVSGLILDTDGTPPGTTYKDSLQVQLIYPDGSGGTTIRTITPDAGGFFQVDSIPIGNQDVQVIYVPSGDTLRHFLSVGLASAIYNEFHLSTNFPIP